jgi:hypothetical protein
MALTSSLVVGVKAPLECWPIAVDRVRYVGEPVAIVVASDRYRAEDAVDLIEMRYRPLPAVSTRSVPQRPTRRFCIRRSTATSSASARFVTATRSARSRKPRIASASTSATRATPARRSKRTASSPNTMPVKMRTTYSPISRDPSVCTRSWHARSRLRRRTNDLCVSARAHESTRIVLMFHEVRAQ